LTSGTLLYLANQTFESWHSTFKSVKVTQSRPGDFSALIADYMKYIGVPYGSMSI